MHVLALLAAGCCEVLGVFFLTKFQKSVGVKKASNFFDFNSKFRPFALAFELRDAGDGDVGSVRDLDGHGSCWGGAGWRGI